MSIKIVFIIEKVFHFQEKISIKNYGMTLYYICTCLTYSHNQFKIRRSGLKWRNIQPSGIKLKKDENKIK